MEEIAEGEEDAPIISEPQSEETTTLLGPGHVHYIPQAEWLNREAQVFYVPSVVPGTPPVDTCKV